MFNLNLPKRCLTAPSIGSVWRCPPFVFLLQGYSNGRSCGCGPSRRFHTAKVVPHQLPYIPCSSESFQQVREKELLYVDKTSQLVPLFKPSPRKFFLSRPRRFGKSLTLSTLKEILQGNRELFGPEYGPVLDIYDHPGMNWEEQKHAVLHLDFTKGIALKKGPEMFETELISKLKSIADKHNITLHENWSVSKNVEHLVEGLALKSPIGKVAVLVDEYDTPITNNLTKSQLEWAEANRQIVQSFFRPLKDLTPKGLNFLFVTGVSRFAKTAFFSVMNDTIDITIDEVYSSIVGYTWEEIEKTFKEHLQALADIRGQSVEQVKGLIDFWYNGYSWGDVKQPIYNPWSINSLFRTLNFEPHWAMEGIPTLLVNMLNPETIKLEQLAPVECEEESFDTLDVHDVKGADIHGIHAGVAVNLLFQTGYLTVKDVKEDPTVGSLIYTLDVPNEDARRLLIPQLLTRVFDGIARVESYDRVAEIRQLLLTGDIKGFFKSVNQALSSVPVQTTTSSGGSIHSKEGYYHSVVHNLLWAASRGSHDDSDTIRFTSEAPTAQGYADMYIETPTSQYVIEFKVKGATKQAEEQVKGYARSLPAWISGKSKTMVVVVFDPLKRQANLEDIVIQPFKMDD